MREEAHGRLAAIDVDIDIDRRVEDLSSADVAEEAGALGRQWLRSHHNIDGADLAIAATAIRTGSRLLTRNVRHFPMFTGLQEPY